MVNTKSTDDVVAFKKEKAIATIFTSSKLKVEIHVLRLRDGRWIHAIDVLFADGSGCGTPLTGSNKSSVDMFSAQRRGADHVKAYLSNFPLGHKHHCKKVGPWLYEVGRQPDLFSEAI